MQAAFYRHLASAVGLAFYAIGASEIACLGLLAQLGQVLGQVLGQALNQVLGQALNQILNQILNQGRLHPSSSRCDSLNQT